MKLRYEGADFQVGWSSSIERNLVRQAVKRRIGTWIGKPYRQDPYLQFAAALLSQRSSPLVVDVGSNIGTTVLPLALRFPEAKFYAIEPHPVPAARFICNCEQNRVQNVRLVSTAIGPISELGSKMAQIYTCPTNSGGHRLTGFAGRKDIQGVPVFGPIAVPVTPLKNLFHEFGLSHCDLLKIDTEGYEVFVLESLQDFLRPDLISHVVAELGPEGLRQAGKTPWDLVSLMLHQGYTCSVLGSSQTIESEKQIPQLPDFTVADLLFSPRQNR